MFLHRETGAKNISLHDCRATHILLSDDEITFVFPDGFWVWGDHDEIHLDDMVRTDTAEVTVKLCGNGAEDVYPYVFTSIGIDKDVRVFYDAERLVKEVNEGNWQLEFLYRYDGGPYLRFDCLLWFGEPYARGACDKECDLRFDVAQVPESELITYSWNHYRPDAKW